VNLRETFLVPSAHLPALFSDVRLFYFQKWLIWLTKWSPAFFSHLSKIICLSGEVVHRVLYHPYAESLLMYYCKNLNELLIFLKTTYSIALFGIWCKTKAQQVDTLLKSMCRIFLLFYYLEISLQTSASDFDRN